MKNMTVLCQVLSLFVVLFILMGTGPAVAGPDKISYQGRLTDASNNPVVDDTYALRFRIYDALTGGTLLWTEYNPGVQTAGGLFSVVLGELTQLDLGAMGSGNLFLEVQVGSSTPLTPRTSLTSAPRAAVAGKVLGDIETSPGLMTIRRSDGDSSFSFGSYDDRVSMRLFDPQPEPPGKAIVDVRADLTNGASIKLFDPQPEPPGKALEIMSGTLGQSVPSIRMFDPQPEPPGKLFELLANSGSGPSMSFFNQAGQVMGVEPTPWNTGFSIKLFDPQPEPPGKMLEIGTSYSAGGAAAPATSGASDTAWLKTYGPSDLGGLQEFIYLYSTDTDAELRLGQGAPLESSSSYFSARSNGLESKVTLVGPPGAAPAPPIVLTSMNGAARVGIGTLTPSQALHVAGNICYTGTIGACSDGRYKKAIEPVENALEMVSELEGVRYQWKTDEYPHQQFAKGTQVGFVAQEVKKVLPEVVMEQPDGSLAIDYGRLTPVLLEAIKELKKQNDLLTRRVEALEKK